MTRLLVGFLLGAATWGLYREVLVPIVGWGGLLGLLVVTFLICTYLVIHEPLPVEPLEAER
jgi:hypothetical protein